MARHLDATLGAERNLGQTLARRGVDIPIESHGHLARTHTAIEVEAVALVGQPTRIVGHIDLEIDIRAHANIEVTLAIGLEVGNLDSILVNLDRIGVASLLDNDILTLPRARILDTHHTRTGRGGQCRVDDDLTRGRTATIRGRNRDPRIVGRCNPVVTRRELHQLRTADLRNLDLRAVDLELDQLATTIATHRQQHNRHGGNISLHIHNLFHTFLFEH